MASSLLPAAVVASRVKHNATLIFLHGLGDTGHGWSDILKKYVPANFKIVCPHAPTMAVTLNNGAEMPSWYDIYGLSEHAKQDTAGIERASSQLEKFVAAEMDAGIPVENIVVGGFSQGGSVALFHALTSENRYGGVLPLSSWLPEHTRFFGHLEFVKIPRTVPIFQCHGQDDNIIPVLLGRASHEVVKYIGMCNTEFRVYPNLAHSSNEEELTDVQKFLQGISLKSE